MSTHWEDTFGNIFETEEEALENAYEIINEADFEERFSCYVGYSELLKWAREQEAFFEHFDSQIDKAYYDYLDEHYEKVEDEE